ACPGRVILGPRAASKTADFQVPADLPPDLPEHIRPGRVTHVETLAEGLAIAMASGSAGSFKYWREFIEAGDGAEIRLATADGHPALIRHGAVDYLCGWPDGELLSQILTSACDAAGLRMFDLPDGVRLRCVGSTGFVMNYSDDPFEIALLGTDIEIRHGEAVLPPSGFAVIGLTK
ncbi:MAG: beta-galactosidase, partial [Candidatus Puniceispirillaceae bacterium]